MKRLTIIILFLILFAIVYTFIIFKFDIGTMSYNDYNYNPKCNIKYLGDGLSQISNCAVYKLDEDKLYRETKKDYFKIGG